MLVTPPELLKRRTYNVTAMSFTPAELVAAVRKHFPDISATYRPDARQAIGKTIQFVARRKHAYSVHFVLVTNFD